MRWSLNAFDECPQIISLENKKLWFLCFTSSQNEMWNVLAFIWNVLWSRCILITWLLTLTSSSFYASEGPVGRSIGWICPRTCPLVVVGSSFFVLVKSNVWCWILRRIKSSRYLNRRPLVPEKADIMSNYAKTAIINAAESSLGGHGTDVSVGKA